jgi:hypothetical protein
MGGPRLAFLIGVLGLSLAVAIAVPVPLIWALAAWLPASAFLILVAARYGDAIDRRLARVEKWADPRHNVRRGSFMLALTVLLLSVILIVSWKTGWLRHRRSHSVTNPPTLAESPGYRLWTSKFDVRVVLRKPGDHGWYDGLDAFPGDTVQWLVEVIDGGPNVQHDGVAYGLLPPHLAFVPGSAKWYDAHFPNGQSYDWDQFNISSGAGGYDFGAFLPGDNVLLRFDTTVAGDFIPCKVTVRMITGTRSTETPTNIRTFADLGIIKPSCKF